MEITTDYQKELKQARDKRKDDPAFASLLKYYETLKDAGCVRRNEFPLRPLGIVSVKPQKDT